MISYTLFNFVVEHRVLLDKADFFDNCTDSDYDFIAWRENNEFL